MIRGGKEKGGREEKRKREKGKERECTRATTRCRQRARKSGWMLNDSEQGEWCDSDACAVRGVCSSVDIRVFLKLKLE